jgi:cytidine deaminase
VIRAIAATNRDALECSPCGACRQVIAEFSTDETIILYRYAGSVRRITMRELLPDGFKFTR